jgi:antirestriction protein ArdC
MTEYVPSQTRLNVYEAVTKKIVAAIEEGAGTYRTPWSGAASLALPTNASTLAEYRGVNVLALWAERLSRGFASPFWATYKQWSGLGAQVRKGERASLIVFYKRAEIAPTEPGDDQASTDLRFFARASWVFNAAQVDGYAAPEQDDRGEVERVREVEAFIEALRADMRHGFTMAQYHRKLDRIEMPSPDAFTGSPTSSPTEAYYATLLHELTHWSGAAHRLNREALRGRSLCDGGTGGGARRGLHVRRVRDHERTPARPCRLCGFLAQSPRPRQPCDLHGGEQGAGGIRPPRLSRHQANGYLAHGPIALRWGRTAGA